MKREHTQYETPIHQSPLEQSCCPCVNSSSYIIHPHSPATLTNINVVILFLMIFPVPSCSLAYLLSYSQSYHLTLSHTYSLLTPWDSPLIPHSSVHAAHPFLIQKVCVVPDTGRFEPQGCSFILAFKFMIAFPSYPHTHFLLGAKSHPEASKTNIALSEKSTFPGRWCFNVKSAFGKVNSNDSCVYSTHTHMRECARSTCYTW